MIWEEFYSWLDINGYDIVRKYNIFRGNKFITSFDPVEDDDSGEIEETIEAIKKIDVFKWNN